MRKIASERILDAVTATGAGERKEVFGSRRTFQVFGTTSSGAGAATVKVQVSDDTTPSQWDDLVVFDLILGTAAVSDRYSSTEAYRWVRGNVTALSGSTATVTLNLGTDLEG